MDDLQIYSPQVIVDVPLPEQGQQQFVAGTMGNAAVGTPATIQDNPLPVPHIAHQLISEALNTKTKKIYQEFKFTQFGAIQAGEYHNGVSGDVRVSQNGIVARDKAGNTTFALDGDTGDAVFAGEIQSGSLVTGLVAIGNDSIIIDGENRRMIFYDANNLPSIVIGEV